MSEKILKTSIALFIRSLFANGNTPAERCHVDIQKIFDVEAKYPSVAKQTKTVEE